jgi:hypothetical protein
MTSTSLISSYDYGLAGGAAAMGIGIRSMHFTAMLAYVGKVNSLAAELVSIKHPATKGRAIENASLGTSLAQSIFWWFFSASRRWTCFFYSPHCFSSIRRYSPEAYSSKRKFAAVISVNAVRCWVQTKMWSAKE